jgi:CheY-like chemotaxis protein
VREAASGTEAIAMLDADCSPVALLLTDMVMPGMSGIALAEEVRRRDPRAKVLFMTGYSEEALARRASGAEDFPVLQKPFTVTALGARIREVLDAP